MKRKEAKTPNSSATMSKSINKNNMSVTLSVKWCHLGKNWMKCGALRRWWCILRTASELLMDDTETPVKGHYRVKPISHKSFDIEITVRAPAQSGGPVTERCDLKRRGWRKVNARLLAARELHSCGRAEFARRNCWAVFALTGFTALVPDWKMYSLGGWSPFALCRNMKLKGQLHKRTANAVSHTTAIAKRQILVFPEILQ